MRPDGREGCRRSADEFQHATTGSNSVFPSEAKLRHRHSAGMSRWPSVAGASELEFCSERKCDDFSWRERGNRGKLENTCAAGKQGSLGRFSNRHAVGKRRMTAERRVTWGQFQQGSRKDSCDSSRRLTVWISSYPVKWRRKWGAGSLPYSTAHRHAPYVCR